MFTLKWSSGNMQEALSRGIQGYRNGKRKNGNEMIDENYTLITIQWHWYQYWGEIPDNTFQPIGANLKWSGRFIPPKPLAEVESISEIETRQQIGSRRFPIISLVALRQSTVQIDRPGDPYFVCDHRSFGGQTLTCKIDSGYISYP